MFLGDYRVEIVPDCEFRLDGGAMFGIVPRVVWERVSQPDDQNRIRMNMNCLFVETPTERILVETGIGEKWNETESARFGIDRDRPFSESLRAIAGVGPEDITIVVNTHLHFDHAGGNTIIRSGSIVPQFPNARYLVSESEYRAATNPSDRDRASYRSENWLAIENRLELMPDDYEVVEGLRMTCVRGHSATMQTVRIDRGGTTLYGFADLIPTRAHLPFAWIMGFDLFPLETLAAKKRLLPAAVDEDWICLFYHDPVEPLGRLRESDGKIFAESLSPS